MPDKKTTSIPPMKIHVQRQPALPKRNPFRQKDEEKKKQEEAAAAEVYAEYIASFSENKVAHKTFVRGQVINPENNTTIDTKDSGKLYRPASKLAEVAEEIKKVQEIEKELSSKPKKEKEKKKSNLELFKEELARQQEERDLKNKLKSGDISSLSSSLLAKLPSNFFRPPRTDEDMPFLPGDADPNTTNIYISAMSPKINEEMLCRMFGKYGPLASVKIMWPRTEEEKTRTRNAGFVAYMSRHDATKALEALNGLDIYGVRLSLSWGKGVPLPALPIYVPPEMIEAQTPPPPSGLPFNAQICKRKDRDFDGNLEFTIVKVVLPSDRNMLSLINRMCEFVVREGPMFEAMIMNREISNPTFRFLFDNKCPEHIYYRWRTFSLLQGDTPQMWSELEFRMFVGGSVWKPPKVSPFTTAVPPLAPVQLPSAHIPSAVSGTASPPNMASLFPVCVASSVSTTTSTISSAVPQPAKRSRLSERQRDKLEEFLRKVTVERSKIMEVTVWSLDHAEWAEEIVECVYESLTIAETPIPLKLARLFVLSDILYNSSAKVLNASYYRKGFEGHLLEIAEHFRDVLPTISSRVQADKFRRGVLACFSAWQDWCLYPPGYLINLQNTFAGIPKAVDVFALEKEPEEDIDGFPLTKDEPETDGIPLSKDDLEVDGIPLEDDIDGLPLGRVEEDVDGEPVNLSDKFKPVTTPAKKPKEDDALAIYPKSKWDDDMLDVSRSSSGDAQTSSAAAGHSKWDMDRVDADRDGEPVSESTSRSRKEDSDHKRKKKKRDRSRSGSPRRSKKTSRDSSSDSRSTSRSPRKKTKKYKKRKDSRE